MLVQITAPVSACFLCLYTCVGVWVRECDQVYSVASIYELCVNMKHARPKVQAICHFIVCKSASYSPPTFATPLIHWKEHAYVFFLDFAKYFTKPFSHTWSNIKSVSIGKPLKHRLNQSLTHCCVLSAGSAALWNGWHPGWVQTPAGRQGTAGMYSEQSQDKQCLKRVLRNLLEHFITQLCTIYSSWSCLLGSLVHLWFISRLLQIRMCAMNSTGAVHKDIQKHYYKWLISFILFLTI